MISQGATDPKAQRQRAIRELVSTRPIGSQREVVDALTEQGFAVTQATVSRDISELGLVKAPGADGHVYVTPDLVAPGTNGTNGTAPSRGSDARLERILGDIPVTIGRSGLILVLTGTPGTASVIAQAIDESSLHEQEGTLAGDNTLLVLFADESRLGRWLERFETIAARSGGSTVHVNKVVLAYSGGLDTSVAVAWLREQFNAEVVTLTVDLGGGSLRKGVEQRAMSAGASRAYVVDARERFITDFVWPHLQANALYQGVYPLATALARPLIAQLLVEVAKREGADAVAHGCTGKGNDQVRFDIATHALDPGLEVVAPMRVGMGLTRDQEIDYAAERGIEIPITKASPYSIDVNLWGRSCETGILEDPVGHAAGRRLRVDRRRGRRARHRSSCASISRAASRSRSMASGWARSSWSSGSTRWAARTVSGGSTTSRTGWSGSRVARSTRRRPRRSSTRRIARSRG